MKNLKKNFEKLESAIKELELNYNLVLEAKKNIRLKKSLEDEVRKLKKEKILALELVDQALKEIEILRNNVVKERTTDG